MWGSEKATGTPATACATDGCFQDAKRGGRRAWLWLLERFSGNPTDAKAHGESWASFSELSPLARLEASVLVIRRQPARLNWIATLSYHHVMIPLI